MPHSVDAVHANESMDFVEIDEWCAGFAPANARRVARDHRDRESRCGGRGVAAAAFPADRPAYVIGVTGAPDGQEHAGGPARGGLSGGGRTVGIIAVDPTSPYTGGAILGDRIRMQAHATDSGVFIRSMATRGFLGGLARATADVALVLDAAGKQIVMIETVGVGQDEIDIVRLADCTVVLLVPGMGDDVQSMKAGLMEVADIFVINKADREGADRLEQQLAAMLQLLPEPDASVAARRWCEPRPPGAGIEALVGRASRSSRARDQSERQTPRQTLEHWKERLIVLAGGADRRARCRREGPVASGHAGWRGGRPKERSVAAVRELMAR